MSASTSTPATLDYAPRPSARRKWILRAAIAISAMAVAAVALIVAPVLLTRIQTHRLVSSCLAYSPPADQLVYTENAQEIRTFTRLPDRIAATGSNGRMNFAFSVPNIWSQLYAKISGVGFLSSGTIFMHERKTAGKHRLICIDLVVPDVLNDLGRARRTAVVVRMLKPTSPLEVPAQTAAYNTDISFPLSNGEFRVFAGQIDPADPSHFTIDYTLDGRSGVIDGWLHDDETVALEPRE